MRKEMNTDQQFARFINSIDTELQARTGDPDITHLDFEEFNLRFEFEIGATVAETVSELLIQHNRAIKNLTSLC